MAARQAGIDSALPGRANRVIASSADKARSLIFSESAADPGAFYLYAGGRATLVAAVSPTLSVKAGAEMKAIRYRARDGLEISGFLTLPAGRDAKGLPLIVMPHGGPFARDDWGYDPWVQYLADRGYAVLQPNYRGSTGFGRGFVPVAILVGMGEISVIVASGALLGQAAALVHSPAVRRLPPCLHCRAA